MSLRYTPRDMNKILAAAIVKEAGFIQIDEPVQAPITDTGIRNIDGGKEKSQQTVYTLYRNPLSNQIVALATPAKDNELPDSLNNHGLSPLKAILEIFKIKGFSQAQELIIPLAESNQREHWVAIYVKQKGEKIIVSLEDPKSRIGSIWYKLKDIKDMIKILSPNAMFVPNYIGQQAVLNEIDCGPWVVENILAHLAGRAPNISADIEQVRQRQRQLGEEQIPKEAPPMSSQRSLLATFEIEEEGEITAHQYLGVEIGRDEEEQQTPVVSPLSENDFHWVERSELEQDAKKKLIGIEKEIFDTPWTTAHKVKIHYAINQRSVAILYIAKEVKKLLDLITRASKDKKRGVEDAYQQGLAKILDKVKSELAQANEATDNPSNIFAKLYQPVKMEVEIRMFYNNLLKSYEVHKREQEEYTKKC